MTRCLSCASEIPDTSRFCLACGKPVTDNSETAIMPGPATAGSSVGDSRASSVRARVSSSGGRFTAGVLLAGRYQIIGLLGKGGMGEVYRANDLTLDQPVALKFLPRSMAADAGMLSRFQAEVRIARQVSHPNVIRVYDIGELNGQPYLSMEYVDGEDLGSLLRRIGRLPPDKALEVSRCICAGLAAAHDKGVLHRDLKPSNIMIDGEGHVFITDFGLAAVAGELRDTQAREGTPAYMSPEQLAGTEVTARSDIYALGLLIYEMFTGKRPFEAATLDQMMRLQQKSAPVSVSSTVKDVDPAVESIIQRCLAADPRRRPASALAVAAALPGGDPLAAALAAGETPSPGLVAAAGDAVGIRPAVALACLAAIIAGLAGIMLLGARVQMIGQIAMEYPTDVLAQKSRDLARALGYTAKPAGTALGFHYDGDYMQYVQSSDPSPQRWKHRLGNAQPSPILFWYRQSPRPLRAEVLGGGSVSISDPAPIVSGMLSIVLDPQGRLVEFEAVPPQVDDTAIPASPPDWKPLFSAAGLDLARFSAAAPRWNALGSADVRAAWTGPGSLRVEVASWRGKPVYFQLIGPWTRPDRMQSAQFNPAIKAFFIAVAAIAILLLVAAALLARHNSRRGRSDPEGALRLAGLTTAVIMMIWAFGASHVAHPAELLLFAGALSYALLMGAAVWVFYMAIEPAARRRWPQSMITWNRLLAGGIRDPLVGRDMLVGITFGVLAILIEEAHLIVLMRFGATPLPVFLDSLVDVRRAIAMFLTNIPNALLSVLVWFILIFVLRTVLRREWLAATGMVLVYMGFSALTSTASPALAAVFSAFETGVLLFVMLRYGLVALMGAIFAYQMFVFFPITADFSSWYIGTSLFGILSVAAVAAWACHAALAGRPLFREAD